MNSGKNAGQDLPDGSGPENKDLRSLRKLIGKYEDKISLLEFLLGERKKELWCQNQMSVIFSMHHLTLREIVEKIVNIIPPAWQFPEKTGVLIRFRETTCQTPNFMEGNPELSEPLKIDDEPVGIVRICFNTDGTEKAGEAFLPEESDLLHSIVQRLSNYIALIEKEAAKRKQESIYRSFLSASPDMIAVTDMAGEIRFVSDSAPPVFGYQDSSDFIGHNIFEFLHPSRHSRAMEDMVKLMAGEDVGAVEHHGIRKDGTILELEVTGKLIPDEPGEPAQLIFVSRVITDRKTAERELKLSEEKYRLIFETVHDVYYEADMSGNILEISPSVKILTKGQFSREELIDTSLLDHYFNPEDRGRFIQQLKAKGSVDDFELLLQNKDGSVIPVSVSSALVTDHDGKPFKIAGSVRDVTERRRAYEEMRKFSTITDKANYGVCIASPEGQILYVNPCWARMHGWEVQELDGKHISIFHHESQRREVEDSLKFLFRNGEFDSLEIGHARKDGTTFLTLMNAIAIYEGDQPIYISSTAIDITDTKAAQEALRISEEKLNIAQEMANMGSWELDTATGRTTWSRNYIKLIERNSLDFKPSYENFLSILHPDDQDKIRVANQQIEHTKSPVHMEIRLVMPDGRIKWVTNYIVPGFTDGKLTSYRGVSLDITERKLQEQEIIDLNASLERRIAERTDQLKSANEDLVRAREEAESANMAKSEFLSRMSHELRTPLNSILGFAQVLGMGNLDTGQRKGVNHILQSGKHLLDLINEVLDISRIEAGRITFSPEPLEVSAILKEILDIVKPQADARKVWLEMIATDGEDYFVRADRQRLMQILLNLVSNAVKYNKEGGTVWVHTTCTASENDEQNCIRISVKDTGIGINEKDFPRLFQPFERIGAENSTTEGTGLGLAVVKKLMDLMGGNMGMESTPDVGSTFWIELPVAEGVVRQLDETNLGPEKHPGSNTWAGSILYIEDNKSNIDLIASILETTRPGIHLINTMYGKQAPGLVLEFQPDLVLLDLNLPDIHGKEVLRNLKADERTRPVPVVIITADATHSHLHPLLKEGAHACLCKPIEVTRFLQILDQFFKKSLQP